MGFALLGLIKTAKCGNRFGSGLAVDGQAICLLVCLDLRADAAKVVPVLRIEASEAVLGRELLQLAVVAADATVLQHAGEYELALAVRDLDLSPEWRPSESVPVVGIDAVLDHAYYCQTCGAPL